MDLIWLKVVYSAGTGVAGDFQVMPDTDDTPNRGMTDIMLGYHHAAGVQLEPAADEASRAYWQLSQGFPSQPCVNFDMISHALKYMAAASWAINVHLLHHP